MKKISSDDITDIVKAFFVLPLVVCGIFFVIDLYSVIIGDASKFSIFPILAFLIFILFGAKATSKLVDEVYDDGDSLIVRRNKVEIKIPLGEILYFEDQTFSRPAKIKLVLLRECEFGSVVKFIPINSGSKFRSDFAKDLSQRILRSKK